MSDCFEIDREKSSITIMPILTDHFSRWISEQSVFHQNWINAHAFVAESGSVCLLPDEQGQLAQVLIGIQSANDFWKIGALPAKLPAGIFSLCETDSARAFLNAVDLKHACLAWGLGHYQFNRYRRNKIRHEAKLLVPLSVDEKALDNMVCSISLVRDLINTPMEAMGPDILAAEALKLAQTFGATVDTIVGDALLEKGFPLVHAVGRAGAQAPRLIDLRWGKADAPRVTLVGKGVCFDTGGINLKSAAGMRFMKKDMAGAAHVLGLARMVMAEALPVSLRVLMPAVDNAIDKNCIRPGDVIKTRAGITVEITNTDAEGRLILGDALTEAVLEKPDCLIDFATLTGGFALGPELPSLFSNNDVLADELISAAHITRDPMWRMPLQQTYRRYLKSDFADIVNSSKAGHAGSITAALYLQHFVPDDIAWAHFDMVAWNGEASPGKPAGGEACALRAAYHYLLKCYG